MSTPLSILSVPWIKVINQLSLLEKLIFITSVVLTFLVGVVCDTVHEKSQNPSEHLCTAGFPPIREFRENCEHFFQSGEIREKQWVFNQNQGTNFQIRENFQQLVNRSKVVDTCISVSIINWCFCKQDSNSNWKPHLFINVYENKEKIRENC